MFTGLKVSAMDITSQAESSIGDNKKEEDALWKVLDDVDYSQIQNVLDDIKTGKERFNFSEYVKQIVTGEKGVSITGLLGEIKDTVLLELETYKKVIGRLIVIAVIAAIFTNFSNIFQNNQVSETAFYVTYLLLFTILSTSFYMASNIAVGVLQNLLSFMKVLIPTYMISIAFSAGATTSMAYYESTLFIITLMDVLLLKVVIPMINVYFVLILANHMLKEDMLSKLTELIEMIVNWILKTLFAVVVGFNTIQGLIIPMAEHVKNSAFIKGTKALPGIGNAINTVTETILGAGVLVKNAIGVGGLVVILMICLIPLIKLAFFVIVYKFGVAIVQPISDKRVIGCISATSNSAKLLLTTVFLSLLLFMVSIAIIAASTNLRV